MSSCSWRILIGAAAFMVAVGLAAPPPAAAQGIPIDTFEMDGDTADGGGDPGADWGPFPSPGQLSLPPFLLNIELEDWPSPGGQQMTKGSKDTHDIDEWAFKTVTNTTPKDDLQVVRATAINDPTEGVIVYFAAERLSVQGGTTSFGFWVFGGIVELNPDFSDDMHVEGDGLIVVDVGGSEIEGVRVFQWRSGALTQILDAGAADCENFDMGGDYYENEVCGAVSDDGHFLEIAADIDDLFGDLCVSSAMATTRTANSPNASVKNFVVLDDYNLCDINVTKSCRRGRVANVGLCQDTGDRCTVDGDCSVGGGNFPIACDISNPQFVKGSDYVTQFDVTITGEGPGTLFDLTLLEKEILPATNAVCDWVATDGVLEIPAVPLDINGTPTLVDAVFNEGSKTFTVECITDENVSKNRIIVAAKTDAQLSEPDIGGENSAGGDFTFLPDASECKVNPNPSLSIVKECLPETGDLVGTIKEGDHVEFTVPYKITVTNTGDADLFAVNVTDDRNGAHETFDLPAFSVPHVIEDVYRTALPDLDGQQTIISNGCNIMFTNKATVQDAADRLGRSIDYLPISDMDTCPLCPDSCNRTPQ